MEKTFDELFDDFFKRNNINPEDNISDDIKDKVIKMLDLLTNFKNNPEEGEKKLDGSLGKPDKIEFFNDGDMFFERRIWHTPYGDIQKIIISEDPTLVSQALPEKPLEEKLNEAIEAEEYEKAAIIRDLIENEKKLKKNPKKIRKVKK